MTFLRALLLTLWTGVSLWTAEIPNANRAASSPGRIIILGDSITAGYGLETEPAYPALIQQKINASKLPFTVVNAGISGDTTASGLRRINWALGSSADVLVIALGGNDGLRGIPPKQTAENLTGIITKARAKFPALKVLIAGMQMPSNMGTKFTEEFSAVFPAVASANNATLIPYLLEGVGGVAKLNQPDQIHPTAEGQKIIAENVWKILEPQLATK